MNLPVMSQGDTAKSSNGLNTSSLDDSQSSRTIHQVNPILSRSGYGKKKSIDLSSVRLLPTAPSPKKSLVEVLPVVSSSSESLFKINESMVNNSSVKSPSIQKLPSSHTLLTPYVSRSGDKCIVDAFEDNTPPIKRLRRMCSSIPFSSAPSDGETLPVPSTPSTGFLSGILLSDTSSNGDNSPKSHVEKKRTKATGKKMQRSKSSSKCALQPRI